MMFEIDVIAAITSARTVIESIAKVVTGTITKLTIKIGLARTTSD